MKKIFTSFILGLIIALSFNYCAIAPATSTNITPIESIKEPAPTTIISPNTENGRQFAAIMQYALNHNLSERSMDEIMREIAVKFLGTKYEAGLLDRSPRETLVITFDKFDCFIYVETVLALARNIALQDYDYQSFTNNLIDQRYKNANLDGYCSRLHYFSEWIEENEKRENIENIALDLGAITAQKKLNFMSSHRDSYPKMIKNDDNYKCIVDMEEELDGSTIDYIPTKDIQNTYSKLRSGDIIGVATNIPGLDVTHTGLIYRYGIDKVGFIHASPAGQVTIAPDLFQYISNVNNSIGIVVTRPLDPRQ